MNTRRIRVTIDTLVVDGPVDTRSLHAAVERSIAHELAGQPIRWVGGAHDHVKAALPKGDLGTSIGKAVTTAVTTVTGCPAITGGTRP